MLNPSKFEVYLKLAELHFSMGKLDNLILARKYFCFILGFNDMALRPLLGLMRTCEMLSAMEKNEVNEGLLGVVGDKLKEIYSSQDLPKGLKGLY